MRNVFCHFTLILMVTVLGCGDVVAEAVIKDRGEGDPIRVVMDTNPNVNVDDQHALAYLLMSGDVFVMDGITVNANGSGSGLAGHLTEARRIVDLCDRTNQVAVYPGAEGDYETISATLASADYDGHEAVDYIIAKAIEPADSALVLIVTGTLTNVALALDVNSEIEDRIRVVWLGTNYPVAGEFNLESDLAAFRRVLASRVPLEIVTVRYGLDSGAERVQVPVTELEQQMAGLGPVVATPVTGRHGGQFTTFGDYSVSLIENNTATIGTPPAVPLYDLVAVAVVKNPDWADATPMPAPAYTGGAWQEQPDNGRPITLLENFDKEAILADFYSTLKRVHLVQQE